MDTRHPHDAGKPRRSQTVYAWRPADRGLHLTEWACEMAGTAILLLGGLSAVALNFGRGSAVAAHVPSVSLRLLITGMMFAATGSLIAVSPLGRRSGAHLNPAVTFAFWATGHVQPLDLAGYVVAQCLGAVGGTALLRLAWGETAVSIRDGMTLPGHQVSPAAAIGIEALMTGVLVLTILLFVSSARTARWTPMAVWPVITTLVWRGATYTGTSLNPARSLGPAVIAGNFHEYGLYVAGPLTGALAAVLLLRVAPLELEPLTAKLFYHPTDPSIFKSALPTANRTHR
jgi:aquaporin Z